MSGFEDKTRSEWSKLATEITDIQKTKNEVLNPVLVRFIEKYTKPGDQVFEYGCGWGEFADLLSQADRNVVAFDASDEMVAAARKRFLKPQFLTKQEFADVKVTLQHSFETVTSNLVLCILENQSQVELLHNAKQLLKQGGKLLISFCHPKYDFLPESLVSTRIVPPGATYESTFEYEKVIKENGGRFHDFHRPTSYYESLFRDAGFHILEVGESETFTSSFPPDFIVYALVTD